MILMGKVAIQKTNLSRLGNNGGVTASDGKTARTDIKQQEIVIIFPFDAVIIVGIVIAAGGHVIQHTVCVFRWCLKV